MKVTELIIYWIEYITLQKIYHKFKHITIFICEYHMVLIQKYINKIIRILIFHQYWSPLDLFLWWYQPHCYLHLQLSDVLDLKKWILIYDFVQQNYLKTHIKHHYLNYKITFVNLPNKNKNSEGWFCTQNPIRLQITPRTQQGFLTSNKYYLHLLNQIWIKNI